MNGGFTRWLPAVCIIVLLIVHSLLWHRLMANNAAASLFSSGPEHSAAIFVGMIVFMASRMILYLFVPGYVAALLVGKLMSRKPCPTTGTKPNRNFVVRLR